jgi:hypothetical protein
MGQELQYQIRIYLNDEFAKIARADPSDPALKPLTDILAKHRVVMISVYDAFAEYVAEAEKRGVERFPLYKWTKATIEDPAKKEKHIKVFTLYAGGDEVYAKEVAGALEADLQPLIGGEIVARLSKHDTNPANNPQAPERFR